MDANKKDHRPRTTDHGKKTTDHGRKIILEATHYMLFLSHNVAPRKRSFVPSSDGLRLTIIVTQGRDDFSRQRSHQDDQTVSTSIKPLWLKWTQTPYDRLMRILELTE